MVKPYGFCPNCKNIVLYKLEDACINCGSKVKRLPELFKPIEYYYYCPYCGIQLPSKYTRICPRCGEENLGERKENI